MTKIVESEFFGRGAVEITTAGARMVLLSQAGPRVAFFGRPGGRNLLRWDKEAVIGQPSWLWAGGHRIWTTRPMADECAESYLMDDQPCRVHVGVDTVRLEGPPREPWGLQKSLWIEAMAEDTFRVRVSATNTSPVLWSGGLWAITVTAPGPGDRYGVPLGGHGDWDSFHVVVLKRWGGAPGRVNDPQFRMTEDCLVAEWRRTRSKRLMLAPQGVVGMTSREEGVSFIKRATYFPGRQYPLGANIAVYIDGERPLVEMETMGPEQTLPPGGALDHSEIWGLRPPVDWERLTGPFGEDLRE